MTVRGVMMSRVRIAPMRKRFRRMRDSEASKTPCSSPRRASAATSSLETVPCPCAEPRFIARVMSSLSQTRGAMKRTSQWRTKAEGAASWRQ